jgi:RpiB/LacA/LacB family sugar-phosphate isomerase
MTIYMGADHGGFALKEKLKQLISADGYEVADMGASAVVADDDYPDFGKLVAMKVSQAANQSLGILLCRSGFGMDIVANKFPHVRAALAMSPDHIYQGRHDDDVNVLVLAADFIDEATAGKIVKVFLSTPFAKDERYARRLEKIAQIELGNH